MRKSTIYLFILVVTVVVAAAIASAGVVVSAQNSNSSTTMANTNKAKPKTRRSRRGAARKTDAATTDAGAAMTAQTPKRTGKCDPTQQEQTDLSGTYVGKATHGKTPPVDATLTITGNNFTMTSGTDNHSGRITAVTTCGYIGVTMMMGDMTPPTPSPNPPPPNKAMSLRAKKVGDKLMLMSVPGEPMEVKFVTNGMDGGMGMKPHKRRAKSKTMPKTEAPAKPTP